MITLVWLRRDLRLADNPALTAAARGGGAVVPVYVWDPGADGAWAPGAAARWWLARSLTALAAALAHRRSRLIVRAGDTATTLAALVRKTGAGRVVWNRPAEPAAAALDRRVEAALGR